MADASLAVLRLGAEGDGVAAGADGRPVYLPFTLPGEIAAQGDPPDILRASPERVEPPCPHFGTCGGCTLQHWRDDAYAAWKRGLLVEALARAGYPDAPVADLARTPPSTRRRIDLALRRQGPAVLVGLHRRGHPEVVDLRACAVLHPALAALIEPLRDLLRRVAALRRDGAAVLNLLDTGPDLLLRLDGTPDSGDRGRLAAFGFANGVPRIAVATAKGTPEIAYQSERPWVRFDGGTVTPPPGAFLQAAAAGEAAIRAAVLGGLPAKLTGRARIAELHAGCGTLTFALAGRFRVAAFEGDAEAAAALRTAANALPGRIEVSARDLVRQPLQAKELAAFAAVVLDPPYGGAGPQMAPLAASGVRRIVYVSCNPAVLAREAALLRVAGYQVVSATPIDQFLWSARLESVVVFAR